MPLVTPSAAGEIEPITPLDEAALRHWYQPLRMYTGVRTAAAPEHDVRRCCHTRPPDPPVGNYFYGCGRRSTVLRHYRYHRARSPGVAELYYTLGFCDEHDPRKVTDCEDY